MSQRYTLLSVGGGPAGLAAARGYRAAGGTGPVGIVSDEHRMPYNRPPLTKELLRGEMEEGELPLEEDRWLIENQVSLISGRAVALDTEGHTVTLSGGRELTYDGCVLATGAEPTRLPVPGADHPGVQVVRNLEHVRELLARLRASDEVVVIGSGFIGCEIAASLRWRGNGVTLVSDEELPNAARLGDGAGERISLWLAEQGVSLRLGRPVTEIVSRTGALEVLSENGTARGAMVIMAAGMAPRGELAGAAGLELVEGAVPVDATMRTARTALYAAGDLARAQNATAGRRLKVEHWGDALAQGEVAGRVAAGEAAVWDAVPGFWSQIGERTLKYAAWGDGFEDLRLEEHGKGAFTVWYGSGGRVVGVLTHGADEDYERGRSLISEGAAWS